MKDKETALEMIEIFLETGDINELEDISLYYDGDILDLLEENGLFRTVHFFIRGFPYRSAPPRIFRIFTLYRIFSTKWQIEKMYHF